MIKKWRKIDSSWQKNDQKIAPEKKPAKNYFLVENNVLQNLAKKVSGGGGTTFS